MVGSCVSFSQQRLNGVQPADNIWSAGSDSPYVRFFIKKCTHHVQMHALVDLTQICTRLHAHVQSGSVTRKMHVNDQTCSHGRAVSLSLRVCVSSSRHHICAAVHLSPNSRRIIRDQDAVAITQIGIWQLKLSCYCISLCLNKAEAFQMSSHWNDKLLL